MTALQTTLYTCRHIDLTTDASVGIPDFCIIQQLYM